MSFMTVSTHSLHIDGLGSHGELEQTFKITSSEHDYFIAYKEVFGDLLSYTPVVQRSDAQFAGIMRVFAALNHSETCDFQLDHLDAKVSRSIAHFVCGTTTARLSCHASDHLPPQIQFAQHAAQPLRGSTQTSRKDVPPSFDLRLVARSFFQ